MLESYTLSQNIPCQRELEQGRDELLATLATLRAGTGDAANGWSVSPLVASEPVGYARQLLDRVRTRAEELDKGMLFVAM